MATTYISSTNGLTFPDGTSQVTASNSFKNRIINGAMNINQRKLTNGYITGGSQDMYYDVGDGGYDIVNTNGGMSEVWTLDRWNVFFSGYPSWKVKQVLKNNSGLQVPNFKYQLQLSPGISYQVGAFNISQKIESIYTQDLVGKDVSIQAHLSANSYYTQKVCWQVWALSGSPVITPTEVDGNPIKDYWGTNYTSSPSLYYPNNPSMGYLNNATLLKQGFWTINTTDATYSDSFTMPENQNIRNGLLIAFWPFVSGNTANVMPWKWDVNNTEMFPNSSF